MAVNATQAGSLHLSLTAYLSVPAGESPVFHHAVGKQVGTTAWNIFVLFSISSTSTRNSWIDDDSPTPVINEYSQPLDSYAGTFANGRVGRLRHDAVSVEPEQAASQTKFQRRVDLRPEPGSRVPLPGSSSRMVKQSYIFARCGAAERCGWDYTSSSSCISANSVQNKFIDCGFLY